MTYWVEYEYSYTLLSGEDIEDIDSGRFCCRKKDIEKAVMERVTKELEYERYTDLEVYINDAYPTTDCEV